MTKKLYGRNIILISFLYAFRALIISWNVIQVLFFQKLSLNYFDISLLFLTLSISILLFEIPAGIFADFYGRKWSLILSSIFFGMNSIIFFISQNIFHLLMGVICFAMAKAFLSGSIDALLYESLREIKKAKKYQKVLSRNNSLFLVIGIITNFTIPIIFNIDFRLPFLIAFFCSILSIITSLFLYEPFIKNEYLGELTNTNSIKNQFLISIQTISRISELLWLFIFIGFFSISISLFGEMINQPLVNSRYNLVLYGFAFAIAKIVQSFLVYNLDYISKKIKNPFLFLTIAWPLALILMLYFKNIIFFSIFMGFAWFIGSFKIIFTSTKINEIIEKDDKRATIHSTISMLNSLLYLLILPFAGYFLDFVSIIQVMTFLAIISFLISFIILILRKLKLNV